MKIFLMILSVFVFTNLAFAQEIYCPASITCSTQGDETKCQGNPPIGNPWHPVDYERYAAGYDGNYSFIGAGNLGSDRGYCIYRVGRPSPQIGNMFFTVDSTMYPDLKMEGNKWNSVGHGCNSINPEECPFTDTPQ